MCKMDMQVQFLRCKHKHKILYVGEDGLNRSTRIKRKLTFLQVPCICGELFLALPLSGLCLVIRISVRPGYGPNQTAISYYFTQIVDVIGVQAIFCPGGGGGGG